jgi:FkbM family methyltransferase
MFKKIILFFKITRIVKNWSIIPKAYFGLLKNKFYLLELKNGFKFKLRNDSTDLQAFTNVWINEEYNKQDFIIHDDDCVIDIGGHIGLFTIFAAQFCKNGQIITIEPIDENLELLKENLGLNQIKNVKIFNKAVSDKSGMVSMYFDNEDYAAHSLIHKQNIKREIEAITLEKIFEIENIETCDYLKLDCEGSEFMIMENLPSNYFKRIKNIVMEYHLYGDETHLDNLKNRLKQEDFKFKIFPTNKKMGMLFAKRE